MKLLATLESAGERRQPNLLRIEPVLRAISELKSIEPILVFQGLPSQFAAVEEAVQSYCPGAITVLAPDSVMGSACMSLLAADHIDVGELCVLEGDQFLEWDVQPATSRMRAAGADVAAVTFDWRDASRPHAKLAEDGEIVAVQDGPATGGHALAGIYYFRRGVDFRHAVEQMILKRNPGPRGFEVAPAINELILSGQRVLGAQLSPMKQRSRRWQGETSVGCEMLFAMDRSPSGGVA